MNCHNYFHTPCLLKPVSKQFVELISDNPSVWWLSLGCQSSNKSSESIMPTVDSCNEGANMANIILKRVLLNFKKDILTLVSETMDAKFTAFSDQLVATDKKLTEKNS